jgi:SAM-dependent methyltransferase
MPDLDTRIHVQMLRRYRRRGSLLRRIVRAVRREIAEPPVYGLEWGDPDVVEPLRFVRDRYLLPYVSAEHSALEIGPGGGRWTRYLLGFRRLYVVDYYQELLDEVRSNFQRDNTVFIRNNGTDFPGVDPASIDFLFSFGTFVHLDLHLIEAYLANMRSILKPHANVVIQYADQTKIMARINRDFSDNTPDRMRDMVIAAGYAIAEEDLTTMWHSSIVRFQPAG